MQAKDKFCLTPREAGEYIGLGENLVRQLCREKELPCTKVGQNYKIPKATLEAWICEKAVKFEKII